MPTHHHIKKADFGHAVLGFHIHLVDRLGRRARLGAVAVRAMWPADDPED